jgi:DNA-binding LacI/PurR family transcriptional regulator
VDRAELARLVAEDFAFVVIGRRDDAGGPVPFVGADYAAATDDLVSLALGRGHTAFGYVGPSEDVEARDRWAGLRRGLERGGRLVARVDRSGGDAAGTLAALRTHGATIAFFTERADAVQVRRAALAAGLRVPEDLSLVVLGSHVRSRDDGENFTTYTVPREEMARQATQALAARLGGDDSIVQRLLPCERVEGGTLADLTEKGGT